VLENKYVTVVFAQSPPLIEYDCSFNTDFPLVELYDPASPVRASQDPAKISSPNTVRVKFVEPWERADCYNAEEGTFVDIFLHAVPAKSLFKNDAVKLDPKHNEVLLENDTVRVVRVHFAAGESGPIVDKRTRVIFGRTDSHATVTFPDGHSETREVTAASVSFGEPGRQATKNTGTTPIENIVVELKSKDSEKK
jgi:hypothetical protein